MYFSTQGSSLTVAKEVVLSKEGGDMIEVIKIEIYFHRLLKFI